MSKPTILIVPGSFAPPTIYEELVRLLKAKGYPALAVQLPTTMKRMPLAPATMLEDADVIKRAAEALINLGREVVVVAHSYGGVPMTQGLVGVPVKKIVYLTAIVPKIGKYCLYEVYVRHILTSHLQDKQILKRSVRSRKRCRPSQRDTCI
jgi:alpha-beta hydrolase superfamily lysophospholipase